MFRKEDGLLKKLTSCTPVWIWPNVYEDKFKVPTHHLLKQHFINTRKLQKDLVFFTSDKMPVVINLLSAFFFSYALCNSSGRYKTKILLLHLADLPLISI